jgi:hypothetical protein
MNEAREQQGRHQVAPAADYRLLSTEEVGVTRAGLNLALNFHRCKFLSVKFR